MNNYLGAVRRKLIKKPVTIIVALKHKDGVTIGSDGQSSYLSSTAKEPDTKKIVLFPVGDSFAAIAQAGDADLGTRAVEIITEKSRKIKIDHPRAMANVVEESLIEVREKLRSYNEKVCQTASEYQQLFFDSDFSILSACYFNGAPQIHAASFYHGMAIPQMKDYATLGCGSNIAQLLLCDLPISEMSWREAFATAVYVIEKVKKHDSACGGQTHLATLNKDGTAHQALDVENMGLVNQFIRAFEEVDAAEKNSWKNKMLEMIKQVTEMRLDDPPEAQWVSLKSN